MCRLHFGALGAPGGGITPIRIV
eukprot:COSAG06_NODE_57193_length_281_cov_0.851648_1_plen_22_part_01